MGLNLFDIDKDEVEKCHYKFKLLCNRDIYSDYVRQIIEGWTDGFRDRDNKIVREFRDTFHSAFWEFYLHALFKQAGFITNQSHNRPDFMITEPYHLNVEAVIANIRKGGVPESNRDMNDILKNVTPPWCEPTFYDMLDESIVRLSNSVNEKHKKIKNEYKLCEWVNETAPFALAVSSYDQISYGCEYIYSMMALLYGLYFDVNDGSYVRKTSIIKPGTESEIPLGIFNDSAFKDVSGILFSCTTTLGKLDSLENSIKESSTNRVYLIRHILDDKETPYRIQIVTPESPEQLDDGLFLFHNPNTKNKIPYEMFCNSGVYQITFENQKIKASADIYPIVSRLSFDRRLEPKFRDYITQQLMFYNRYPMSDIISFSRDNNLL